MYLPRGQNPRIITYLDQNTYDVITYENFKISYKSRYAAQVHVAVCYFHVSTVKCKPCYSSADM